MHCNLFMTRTARAIYRRDRSHGIVSREFESGRGKSNAIAKRDRWALVASSLVAREN